MPRATILALLWLALPVLRAEDPRNIRTGWEIPSETYAGQGRTWSKPVDVEPADGPEASYAVLLKTPSGRIYAFYNHNTDNLRHVKGDNPPYQDGWCTRVDTQGYFVFKYTDDHGRTWSQKRYPIPVREMQIDRENPYGGKVRYFWNVGRPFTHAGDGGEARQFGWGRFNPNLRDVNGAKTLRIGPSVEGRIHRLRIYNLCLCTSEVIGNYRAGWRDWSP